MADQEIGLNFIRKPVSERVSAARKSYSGFSSARRRIGERKFIEVREYVYNYIDLSNEQVFLRQIGRVSKKTWEYWREGIKSNLSWPVFARVWAEVKKSVPESFQELRRLERGGFSSDPKRWR